MTDNIDLNYLDALWPAFEEALAKGMQLSHNAIHHLLSMAGELSNQNDWDRAWRAVCIARQFVKRSGDSDLLAQVASQRAFLNYQWGDLQEAALAWEEALARFRQLDRTQSVANSHSNLGIIYRSLGEMHKAEMHLRRALALFRTLEDRVGKVSVSSNLSVVCKSLGKTEEALSFGEEALDLCRLLQDKKSEAGCLDNFASSILTLGDSNRALACRHEALSLWKALGERREEAMTLNNLGIIYQIRGDVAQAQNCFNEALELHLSLGKYRSTPRNQGNRATVLVNLGLLYRDTGELSRARAHLEEALIIYQQINWFRNIITTLDILALVHQSLGDPTTALVCTNKALEMAQTGGYRSTEAHLWGNQGLIYQSLEMLDDALKCYERALALHKECNDQLGLLAALINIGSINRLEGRFEDARTSHLESLEIARSLEHKEGQAYNLANLALIYNQITDFLTALDYQEQALSLGKSIQQPELLWQIRYSRSETYRGLEQIRNAVAELKKAVRIIERVRRRLRQDEERLSFFGAPKGNVYALLIAILHDYLKRSNEALEYVERSRSRAFLDVLEAKGLTLPEGGEGEPLRFQELVGLLC